MKRRNALKNIGLFAGGLILLPSCNFSDEKTTLTINKLNINKDEETLVNDLIGTILPEGKTPGGLSLNVQNFVWGIVDECSDQKDQNEFLEGLRLFNNEVNQRIGKDFSSLNSEDKLNVLQEMMVDESTNQKVQKFLLNVKQLSIWGYQNTEYFLTEQMNYKIAPGPLSYKTVTIDNPKTLNKNA